MFLWYTVFILMVVASTSVANDYCRQGTYGNNCEFTCPEQCRPHQIFPCDKKTGQCSEGCNGGYYGDQCDKKCSCPSGICFQEGGECYGSNTTTDKRTRNTTTPPVHNPMNEKVEAGWRTTAIIFIVFFILLLVGVLHLSRNWKKQGKSSSVEMTTENVPLVEAGSDVEAAGGGSEETQSPDDLSGNKPNVRKGSTEVEELKQDNRNLKVERDLAQAKCEEMERQLASFEFQEKEIQRLFGLPPNSTNFFMDKNIWLQCPHLMLDKKTVNVKVAQIDDNMVLLNSQDKNPQNMGRRFQNFQGTTCTEPLTKTGFYQYFEAKFYISLQQPFGEGTVAQFGLCGDKEPNFPFIYTKKPCVVVEVASCKEHKKICLLFMNNGKTTHLKELINNMTGSRHQVHIGIRLRKDLKRIHIFDFSKENSLPGIDIDIGEQIWPMFGVCAQNEATVSVQLIAGRDIEMWKEKKEMIKSKNMSPYHNIHCF